MRTIFALLATAVIYSLVFQSTVFAQDEGGTGYCATITSFNSLTSPRNGKDEGDVESFQVPQILIFLDLDGAVVRRGFESGDNYTSSIISGTRNLPPPAMTADQKAELVRLVADDFSPFNTVVTTDAAEFTATPAQFKQMCIVTTTPQTAGFGSGVGGVSPWAGAGFRIQNSITFAFASPYLNDPIQVAHTVSHEVGHSLGGLPHQHLYNDVCGVNREYHPGFGSGLLAFAPLMGDGSGPIPLVGITNWFGQPCTEPEFGAPVNDYDLLNAQVAARVDDFPDSPAGDTLPSTGEIDGVLSRAYDADYMRINFKKPGDVTITSDNIDLKVSVLNGGGQVVGEYNDPAGRNVTIPRLSGMRYLRIEAVSNENMSAEFMIGTYHLSY